MKLFNNERDPTYGKGENDCKWVTINGAHIPIKEDDIVGKYAYIVKNVNKLNNSKKLDSWWIYPVFNT